MARSKTAAQGRGVWGDPDRRRALLLSVLVHAGVLFGVVALSLRTPPEEPERLIVLELTPPQGGAGQLEAAAADTPAPQRPEAQAAGNATNEIAGAPDATAAETQAQTPPQNDLESSATAASETVAPDAAPETAAAPVRPPSEQPPQARLPGSSTPQNLPAQAPSTTLPEVEAPEVAPQPLEQALSLPTPAARAEVEPAQRIAVTPQIEIAQSQPLPTPDASASIVTQPLVIPQAQAEVAPGDPLPQPEASASVVTRDIPQPQAGATVAAASPLPQPSASGAVVAAAPLPQPQAGATVTESRPLSVTPGAQVGSAVALPIPDAGATLTLPEPPSQEASRGSLGGGGATGSGATAEGAQTAADAGDGASSGQSAPAPASGQGAAADDSGVADAGVANVQSFEATVEQPLAVLLDNADAAYPQQGLVEASSVFEMPVEGGLTRLMSVYTKGDPVQVGPIRSARDYFLEAALQLGGTLVHVGGAPSTVGRIASQNLPTVDALQQGTLFAQAPDRLAPHSTFSTGTALRDAVGRLESQVSGTLYTPPTTAPNANTVNVVYSANYSSGFRYLNDLDLYRWVRNGFDAADTANTAVTADAVVVAHVTAFAYPDDPEGRLYLPYSGGAATLYLRGKAIAGSWTPTRGFTFLTESGAEVDLTPFKHWILFAPEDAELIGG